MDKLALLTYVCYGITGLFFSFMMIAAFDDDAISFSCWMVIVILSGIIFPMVLINIRSKKKEERGHAATRKW